MLLNDAANLREEAMKSRASLGPGVNVSTNENHGLEKEEKRGAGAHREEEARDSDVSRPSIVNAIRKKRDKQELDKDEIDWFVEGATKSSITEAQIGKCSDHRLLSPSSSLSSTPSSSSSSSPSSG